MNCEQTKIELTAYADGNLSESQRAEVLSHLESCPACKTELARIENLLVSCRALPQIEPSSEFAAKVMQRVSPRKATQRRTAQVEVPFWARIRAFVWRPSFGLSALAHAAILIVLAFVVAQASGVFDTPQDNHFILVSSHNVTDADRHQPRSSMTCVMTTNVIIISEWIKDGPVYLHQDERLRFLDVLPASQFENEEGKSLVAGLPRANVLDGKLSIPEDMRANVFGSEKNVVALLLDDRVELWAGSKYDAFKKTSTSRKTGFIPLAFISLQ
jgi:hypothetical protein